MDEWGRTDCGTIRCIHVGINSVHIKRRFSESTRRNYLYSSNTTRNTVIGYTLSKVVLNELHLKYYQHRQILSCPFQLLGPGLSEAVLDVELLLIILWIFSSGSCSKPFFDMWVIGSGSEYEPLLVIRCRINNDLLCEPLLIRLLYSSP
jgi:hypothetical protein